MNLPFSRPGQGPVGPHVPEALPLVAGQGRDSSVWWFAAGAFIAAVLLFTALEARRNGEALAEEKSAATSLAAPETIPELAVPDGPGELRRPEPAGAAWLQPGDARQPAPMTFAPPRVANPPRYQPAPDYGPSQWQPPPPMPAPAMPPYPAPPQEGPSQAQGTAATSGSKRIMAGRLDNLATTVIQGTLINAVLETALDSTRPGQARAVVTRDVYGFDGTRLLISRGTRLYGTYEADLAQGQKRAQIRWSRLLRPDGVSLALDSPAADPLGRSGVPGKVNNHTLQRIGNALLGTTANIGSALVSRNVGNSPVVVAVPGSAQTIAQPVVQNSSQIAPTLTVRQGTRITVFVQHDLDFSSVEDARR